MIPEERYDMIRNILRKEKTISVKDLSKKTYSSEATIRRDLNYLQNSGFLRKIRGGASLVQNKSVEYSSFVRKHENMDKKNYIAKIAAKKFLQNDISIFLDSSSTINSLAPFICNYSQIVVITNAISVATELNDNDNIRVLLSGGRLKQRSDSILGSQAEEFLREYHVDISFISCKFLDFEYVYEADEEQAMIKKIMLKNSNKRILLADSSKFENNSFISTCRVIDFDCIVTDKKPSDTFLKKTKFYTDIIW
ncbi:MAG: DeoR/GlpR family DNA-binding transcription regulator [Peptoniphilaceae bacterium]|nr:DeoR/GlpR family DNA-binding transcription regulator [Peptoniphilaceae bacterium]MDD7382808.1 DeoR/GlpR family DNA-binding transcription regulator [Peptoniphilaceae bacterium]MDY3737965.1 DeoR/GlpR family DNA-binding transcription regulator [Peptoniphilaceae bacterium]